MTEQRWCANDSDNEEKEEEKYKHINVVYPLIIKAASNHIRYTRTKHLKKKLQKQLSCACILYIKSSNVMLIHHVFHKREHYLKKIVGYFKQKDGLLTPHSLSPQSTL